jgi:DnaK suppressor protein
LPYGKITMPRAAKDTKAPKATKAKKATTKAPATKAKAKTARKTPVKAKAPAKAKAKAPAKAKAKAKAKAPAKAKAKAKAPAKATSKTTKARPARRRAKTASSLEFNNFEPYKRKRGEKYMNEVQRDHFRSILLNWKSELMQEVDRTVNHMKDEAANFPDPADRATQEEEFSLELRTRDRERKLIKKIDSTMELIDQNDYGYCEACGIEIGIQRLEARPTATQCIDCKTLAEIKEKQEMG